MIGATVLSALDLRGAQRADCARSGLAAQAGVRTFSQRRVEQVRLTFAFGVDHPRQVGVDHLVPHLRCRHRGRPDDWCVHSHGHLRCTTSVHLRARAKCLACCLISSRPRVSNPGQKPVPVVPKLRARCDVVLTNSGPDSCNFRHTKAGAMSPHADLDES